MLLLSQIVLQALTLIHRSYHLAMIIKLLYSPLASDESCESLHYILRDHQMNIKDREHVFKPSTLLRGGYVGGDSFTPSFER